MYCYFNKNIKRYRKGCNTIFGSNRIFSNIYCLYRIGVPVLSRKILPEQFTAGKSRAKTELLIRSVSSWLRYRSREAEGNEGRKKNFFPSRSRHAHLRTAGWMDGWMDEFHRYRVAPSFYKRSGLHPVRKISRPNVHISIWYASTGAWFY